MKKAQRVRLSCTAPPMFAVYIDHLLKEGMFGDTRAEVIRNVLGKGLMEAIPGETIRQLVEKAKGKSPRR